jgi:hypothetical protein
MSETKREYAANYRNPPLHTRFKKGQSGNPRGRPKKDLPALLVAALGEPVFVTIDGERRKITEREAVITQLVNESAGANLRATKMLIDMMKDIERKTEADPPPEPHRFAPRRSQGGVASRRRPSATRRTSAHEGARDQQSSVTNRQTWSQSDPNRTLETTCPPEYGATRLTVCR